MLIILFILSILSFVFIIFYMYYFIVKLVKVLLNIFNDINYIQGDFFICLFVFICDEFSELLVVYNKFVYNLSELIEQVYKDVECFSDVNKEVCVLVKNVDSQVVI